MSTVAASSSAWFIYPFVLEPEEFDVRTGAIRAACWPGRDGLATIGMARSDVLRGRPAPACRLVPQYARGYAAHGAALGDG
jgi:hypothetical protein